MFATHALKRGGVFPLEEKATADVGLCGQATLLVGLGACQSVVGDRHPPGVSVLKCCRALMGAAWENRTLLCLPAWA